jgi:leader peptidase (prepilin peptidase)/N-methyltransferase
MRPALIAALAAAGLAAGLVLRAVIVRLSVPSGQPVRRACPACGRPLPPVRGAVTTGPATGPRRAAVGPPQAVTRLRRAVTGPRRRVTGPRRAVTRPWRRAALAALSARAALPVLPPDGRCPACRARLGPAALTVELIAAITLGVLAARIHPPLVLAAVCWLALCAIPLAFIDAAARRLPDLLTAPACAGTAVLLLAAAADAGSWARLGRGLAGGAAYAAFCLVLFLTSPSGMGPGDVKLAASLGTALTWLSWGALAEGALAGFLLGAGYGVSLLVRGRAGRKTLVPFGPFMITGTFLVLAVAGLPG